MGCALMVMDIPVYPYTPGWGIPVFSTKSGVSPFWGIPEGDTPPPRDIPPRGVYPSSKFRGYPYQSRGYTHNNRGYPSENVNCFLILTILMTFQQIHRFTCFLAAPAALISFYYTNHDINSKRRIDTLTKT